MTELRRARTERFTPGGRFGGIRGAVTETAATLADARLLPGLARQQPERRGLITAVLAGAARVVIGSLADHTGYITHSDGAAVLG
jgi:hypothetical protein